MTGPVGEGWLDGDAARPVRPYAVIRGRTSPSVHLDLMSMVVATGAGPGGYLEPDHEQALGLCRQPATVAEVAAWLRLPVAAAKVLLSDLAECGALRAAPPLTADQAVRRPLLERVLDGLQRL
ncbi:MAG: hypothetical protein JWM19_2485 [Actinomycetia bacterium]|nr:hypothetical protein [Actinomycetes bacterium]